MALLDRLAAQEPPKLISPATAGWGRPRCPVMVTPPRPLPGLIDADSLFQDVTWRQGSKGAMTSRFAVLEVQPSGKEASRTARERHGRVQRELRDQYVRDPLGLTLHPNDTTATEHRTPTPDGQFYVKNHGVFVDPGIPVALRVTHNDASSRLLTLAEFKLVIHHAA